MTSMSVISVIERINQKCKQAKRFLDKSVKPKKINSHWGEYMPEYHIRTAKVGKSIQQLDQY